MSRTKLIWKTLFAVIVLICSFVAGVRADAGERAKPRSMALGVQLDLFPTIASAAAGEVGYAPQLWLGIDHVRVRFVAAHMELPGAMAFQDGFVRPTTTALALVFDYTFGDHFDRWWIGPGFELWQRSIGHEDSDETARFTSLVATLGAGYIFLLPRNFYIDPWVGVHCVMNPHPVDVGGHEYDPFPLVANASVKIGWFKDL